MIFLPQKTNAGPCIYNNPFVPACNFKTSRVSTIFDGIWSGQGMLPQVPQNLRRMEEVLDIKDMCNCWDNYTILQVSLSLN